MATINTAASPQLRRVRRKAAVLTLIAFETIAIMAPRNGVLIQLNSVSGWPVDQATWPPL